MESSSWQRKWRYQNTHLLKLIIYMSEFSGEHEILVSVLQFK